MVISSKTKPPKISKTKTPAQLLLRRVVSATPTQGWHKGYMVLALGANWLHHEGKWYPIDEVREPLDEYRSLDEYKS